MFYCDAKLSNILQWSSHVCCYLFREVSKSESRVQDASEIHNFIDNFNNSDILRENCKLVSFDIVNMFSSTDNESGIQAVKNILEPREEHIPLFISLKHLSYA